MKKLISSTFVLFCAGVVALLSINWSASDIRTDTMEWSYRISVGDTTKFHSDIADTASLLGALDTLVSKTYGNVGGDMALQMRNWGGTTPRYQIKVQTAIPFRDSTKWADSYSVDWDGAYVDSAKVDTKDDSCTTVGVSPSIYIPALAGDLFRFMAISKSTQVGNTLLTGGIAREE